MQVINQQNYMEKTTYIDTNIYVHFYLKDIDGYVVDTETKICEAWANCLIDNKKSILHSLQQENLALMLTASNFQNVEVMINKLVKDGFFKLGSQQQFDSIEIHTIFYNNIIRGSVQKNRQTLMDLLYDNKFVAEPINVQEFENSEEFLDSLKKAKTIKNTVELFNKLIQEEDSCTFFVTGAPYTRAQTTLTALRKNNVDFVFFGKDNNLRLYQDSHFIDSVNNPKNKMFVVFAEFSKANRKHWMEGSERILELYPNFYKQQINTPTKYVLFEDSLANSVQFRNFFSDFANNNFEIVEVDKRKKIVVRNNTAENRELIMKQGLLETSLMQFQQIYLDPQNSDEEIEEIITDESGKIISRTKFNF